MAKDAKDLEGAGAAALAALQEAEAGDAEGGDPTIEDTPTQREDLPIGEAKARLTKGQLAQILHRGVVNDRLSIKLPPNRVGYWIRDRQEDVDRIIALGGKMESASQLGQKGLHGTGDDRIKIGDVIFMSLPRDVVDAIAEIDEENKRTLLTKGKNEFLRQKIPGVPHYEEA